MSRPWPVWYAMLLHLAWGALLLADGRAIDTTTLHVFAHNTSEVVAGLFIAVAALAGIALRRPRRFRSALLLLPQQAVLILSAVGAVSAMAAGMFGDGVVRPHAFIAADQLPAVLAALFHTAYLVDIHRR